jgi:Ca2+-binding RTX toxin-like protein
MDGSGNFVVAFERQKPGQFTLMSVGVFARRFSATGVPGAEFLVSKGVKLINRGEIAVDMNSGGAFALAWQSTDKPEGIHPWPHLRLYNAAGSAVIGERSLPVNEPAGAGYPPRGTALAMDGDGDFTFIWAQGSAKIVGQRVAGPNDTRQACSIYIATRVGTDVNDTITGTSGADVIQARNGTDWVDGAGGDDIICGGGGSDQLYGSGGNDELYGGMGDDVLDGGAGTDLCDGRKHDNADTAIDCEKVIGVP